MNLKEKFDRIQYKEIIEGNSIATLERRTSVHEACEDPGPLLYDVADSLASYLAESIIAVEKPLNMINGYDWTDNTRRLVMKRFVSSLIARFADGLEESENSLRESSIHALAEFLANQTDLHYYHGA